MAWIAGVDGCKGGWIAVYEDTDSRKLDCRVAVCNRKGKHADCDPSCAFEAVLEHDPPLDVVAVDMPIGLLEKGGRDCDEAARKKLGKRSRSIFSAPASVVLEEWRTGGTYDQAKAKKSLSRQSWALVPKIAEVARYLETNPASPVHEVHPEVSFAAIKAKGGTIDSKRHPMRFSKATAAGLVERRELLKRKDVFGERFEELEARAAEFDPTGRAALDDFYDALACLWTAHRISEGKARALCGVDNARKLIIRKLSESAPKGDDDLPMRIVY